MGPLGRRLTLRRCRDPLRLSRTLCRRSLATSLAAFFSAFTPGMDPSAVDAPPMVYHENYSTPSWPETHRFPMWKFFHLERVLREDGLLLPGQCYRPSIPPLDWIEMVHDREYIEGFLKNSLDKEVMRRIGFQHSPELVERTLLEVGGTVLTCELALRHGLACNLAGGTHHAHRSFGSGFTILNDLAVSASFLDRFYELDKVVILDLDVHQGDGTADIFGADHPKVFTASFHCEANFPFRKKKSSLDVGFDKGAGDEGFLSALRHHLPRIIEEQNPDLIIYDAGVDPHESDSLGHLRLTDHGLQERDRYVITTAVNSGVPIACVIGGGYDADKEVLARRHSILHRTAIQVWRQLGMADMTWQ